MARKWETNSSLTPSSLKLSFPEDPSVPLSVCPSVRLSVCPLGLVGAAGPIEDDVTENTEKKFHLSIRLSVR